MTAISIKLVDRNVVYEKFTEGGDLDFCKQEYIHSSEQLNRIVAILFKITGKKMDWRFTW